MYGLDVFGLGRVPLQLGAQSGDMVVVEVVDPGCGFVPAVGEPRSGQTSGWGLFLVDKIANRWGVHADGVTHVWFEVDRRSNERHGPR